LLGLATSACALAGYNFGDYERGEPTATSEPTAVGGEPSTSVPFDATLTTSIAAGGEKPNDGADARDGAGASATSSGGDAANSADTAGAACRPQTCLELGLECGDSPSLPSSCGMRGTPLDCGACFWWFQKCRQNRCVIPE
jgi:hypothetical protein